MHGVLRERLMRRLETLPDEQLYQVLDFIEFLEAKYAEAELRKEASGLQRFGERLEDSLRKRTVSPGVLREAFHVLSAADRVLSGVASAGKDLLGELDRAAGTGTGDTPAGTGELSTDAPAPSGDTSAPSRDTPAGSPGNSSSEPPGKPDSRGTDSAGRSEGPGSGSGS